MYYRIHYRNSVPSHTATGVGVNQGKTAFVEKFLGTNPDAGHEAVVEAWKSAGKDGTISDSLVNKARSRLKLTGKKRGASAGSKKAASGLATKPKPGTSKAAKAAPNVAEPGKAKGPNKTSFIKEALGRDKTLNARAINRAWTEAGHEGEISANLVSKTRADLGIKGRQVSPRGASTAKPASPTEPSHLNGLSAAPSASSPTASSSGDHDRELHEIEAEIDELVFRLRGLGGYAEVQEALRAARKMPVRSHGV